MLLVWFHSIRSRVQISTPPVPEPEPEEELS